ncbi:MAG: hypothetical protein GY713_11580 [Actinomycetia bacterium]|nr:hypothetical protein [Actinomycetes bacterium]
MRTIGIEGDEVVIEFTQWDKIWAFSSGLRIPLNQVRSVYTTPRSNKDGTKRLPGTYWPNKLMAGTFLLVEGKELRNFRKAPVLVKLELTDHKFRSVVVEVGHPEATAEKLDIAAREARASGA